MRIRGLFKTLGNNDKAKRYAHTRKAKRQCEVEINVIYVIKGKNSVIRYIVQVLQVLQVLQGYYINPTICYIMPYTSIQLAALTSTSSFIYISAA